MTTKSKTIYVHLTYPIEIFENGQYKELSNCSAIEFEECATQISNVNISNYEIHEKIKRLIDEKFSVAHQKPNINKIPSKIKFENSLEEEYDYNENDSNSVCSTNDSIFSNEEYDENEMCKESNEQPLSYENHTPTTDYKLCVKKDEIKQKIISSNKSFKNMKKCGNKFSRKTKIL
jgi:hypothetical protein